MKITVTRTDGSRPTLADGSKPIRGEIIQYEELQFLVTESSDRAIVIRRLNWWLKLLRMVGLYRKDA